MVRSYIISILPFCFIVLGEEIKNTLFVYNAALKHLRQIWFRVRDDRWIFYHTVHSRILNFFYIKNTVIPTRFLIECAIKVRNVISC